MEDAPVAPAEAPASEALPTNPNPAPEAPAAPAGPVADIPADQIEAFNKFVNANGGFERAFAKLRTDVSTPAPQPQPAPPKAEEPKMTTQQIEQFMQGHEQQPQQQNIPIGYITPEEFTAQQYFASLSN